MKSISLETNRRGNSIAVAKEITIQETQGLKDVILKAVVVVSGLMLTFYVLSMQIRIHTLEAERTSLTKLNLNLSSKITQTENEFNSIIAKLDSNIIDLTHKTETLNTEITRINKQCKSLIKDNRSLAKEYDTLFEEHTTLANRKELYDKYEYVVTYGGKRTDVTYSQLQLAEDLMEESGYDPNILMSIIMVESRGAEKAKNSSSTASGYGQFLKGTGKWTYEDLLGHGKGSYNHSIAFNGTTNIKMMNAYLKYLLDRSNGNLFKAIKSYSGRGDSAARSYMGLMNGFSSTVGVNIYNSGRLK